MDEPTEKADREVFAEEEVVRASPGGWSLARGWVRTLGALVAVVVAILETLLIFRLGFLLTEANPDNSFVNFIYDISKPLAEPFQGIIDNESVNGGVFEPATVIAMLVYLIAAILLIAVLLAVTSGLASGGSVVTTRTRHREREVGEK